MNKIAGLKINGHEVYCSAVNKDMQFIKIDDLYYQILNGNIDLSTGKTNEQAENFCRAEEIDVLASKLKAKLFFLQSSGKTIHKNNALTIIGEITDRLNKWPTID